MTSRRRLRRRWQGERTGIPCHSVDDEIGWLPGWTERPVPDQRARAQAVVSGDDRVLHTANGHWRALVLARAELVVAPDGPPVLRLRSPAQTERWLERLGAPAG